MSSELDQYRDDVIGTAEALAVIEIPLPEYDQKGYEPQSIRQERRYGNPDGQTQPITRFLTTRGMVDILSAEHTIALFTEMHWCAHQLRTLAKLQSNELEDWKKASQQVPRLIKRMDAAEEELFIANRQLVVACVKPFYWIGHMWIPDFLQEGSRGLANAIRKFDFTRGVPFYSYSQRSIQNRLRNFFRDHIRTGALGIKPSYDMVKMRDVMTKWRDEHGEEPSNEILSELSGVEPIRIKRLLPLVRQWERMPESPLSLDAVLQDSRSSLYELVQDVDQEQASAAAERNEVWAAVTQLPERMQTILKMRFIEGHTLEEVGDHFALTRARIKQIQDQALHQVRVVLKETMNE